MVCMGLVHNLAGLIVTRVFLGMFESGFFFGTSFDLTMWYRRTEQCIVLAIFFSIATMVSAFGGLLAFGIGRMTIDWPWFSDRIGARGL